MASIFIYDKKNGERVISDDSAPLPDDMTLIAPCSFPKWDEESGGWVFDRDAWLDKAVRPARDKALIAADNRVRRYDLQVRAGIPTAETADKIAELLAYMQVLRDLPNDENLTPENLTLPEVP